MNETTTGAAGRRYWIVSGVALLWNLMGVAAYLVDVSLTAEDLAAMPDAERALYASMPAWVTGAYAIAVFGGTLGCIGLLLRKAWAMPVFVASLVAVLLQFGYTLLLMDTIAVKGAAVVALPIFIILIAAYLVWFAQRHRQAGVLT